MAVSEQAAGAQAQASSETNRETEYLILVQNDEDGSWVKQPEGIKAQNKNAAITGYVNSLPVGGRNGTYKAVSATAWKGGKKIAEKDSFDAAEIDD